jgi:signal transduction histidine kinase
MTVPLSERLTKLASRPGTHRRTLRMRLTLLYGGLFLLSGAALLTITYLLVVNATSGFIFATPTDHGHGNATIATNLHSNHPLLAEGQSKSPGTQAKGPSSHGQSVTQLQAQADQQHSSELHQLLTESGIALTGMALVSILLGWIVAGRVLRPLRTITTTTREISAKNLNRRLALEGPEDELKDLGDTIDALLARLEGSFQAQRAFVANASHELRTPLALSRAMLSFALADPELTLDSLKATCEDVLDAGTDQEQLIEALLTLARSQQGLEHHETFDLASIAHDTIENHQRHAADQQLAIDAALSPAPISGDPRLARTLLTNLLENALRYNVPNGHVNITLDARGQHTTLTVANTGPQVPADQINRLLQPFRRLTPDRSDNDYGHGLGLSIVAAITTAHDATLNIQPRRDGGLHITIQFPAVSADHESAPASTTTIASVQR